MISKIEALNYMCLRHVSVETGNFQLLVGPNGSGKSTFLEILEFLCFFVKENDFIETTIKETPIFENIFWKNETAFELAIELEIPGHIPKKIEGIKYTHCRYEIKIERSVDTGEISIGAENLLVFRKNESNKKNSTEQTSSGIIPDTIITANRKLGFVLIERDIKKSSNNDTSYRYQKIPEQCIRFNLGKRKSALANLPEDKGLFPIAIWLKKILTKEVYSIAIDSNEMKESCFPTAPGDFLPDGSNLPWKIHFLKKNNKKKFFDWLKHIQTVFPDIRNITTVQKPENKHRYLVLQYNTGLKVPSWNVSDGTLKFLALTILPYLSGLDGILLIEEPENGMHPKAVEAVYRSLSSIYDAQVFVTTHSPLMLSLADLKQILCFSKTPEGAVEIIRGNKHPALSDWKGIPNLGLLFAGGALE